MRPTSDLPPRAKLFLAVAGIAIVAFAAWVTVRLWHDEPRVLGIVLIVLSYIGAVAVGLAIVTATRLVFSARALPYLLGRGLRRLLSGR